ncbi:luc7-like protein 3 isoform X2 [Branchiostoma lanceolatum]|uniref:luc7-like protein 3 isoform X2 n=1 Tax=Branchiostoma lanceolatum TaxID=7740 RepID=UPI00345487CD
MSASFMAQMLDELMGRDRNLAPNEKKEDIHWSDEKVCKHFLCSFCPSELFTNTRSDLGPCDKIHDDALRDGYRGSSRFQRMGYEEDFLRYLQSCMADVERRIRRGHARLALSEQQAQVASGGGIIKNEEKIQILTDRINGLLEQVEQLGCEGKVEEAQGVMKLCDQLKEEREQLRQANKSSIDSMTAQEKQMEVCETCGAFLIVGDAQSRVDDHLMGKQHMGYAKIKATIEELKAKTVRGVPVDPEREQKRQKEREDREKELEKEREEREKERERRRKEREEKEKELEKEREREREERRKKRSRSRSKGRRSGSGSRRSRSRERSKRSRRSRSKERSGRHRSRSRSKDKDRKRSSRSQDRKDRDRKRERRSRSRDRKRRSRDRSRSRHRSRSREGGRSSKDKDRSSRDKDRRSRDKSRDKDKHSSQEEEEAGVHQAKEELEDPINEEETANDPRGSLDPEDRDVHAKEAISEEAMDAHSADDDNDQDSKASNEGDTHPDN